MTTRTPWRTKLRPEQKPKLVEDPKGRGRMLVPTPLLVAAEIRKVRRGATITPAELRERLAQRCGADVTCPLTTGIFLSIVAGATEDDRAAGRRLTAPWWRVVDEKDRVSEKVPPGPDRQAELLRAEGHALVRQGRARRWTVQPTTASSVEGRPRSRLS